MPERKDGSRSEDDRAGSPLADIMLQREMMITDAGDEASERVQQFVELLSKEFWSAADLVTSLETMPEFQAITSEMSEEERTGTREEILHFLRTCIDCATPAVPDQISATLNQETIIMSLKPKTTDAIRAAIISSGKHPEHVMINMQRLKAQVLARGHALNSKEAMEHVRNLLKVLQKLKGESESETVKNLVKELKKFYKEIVSVRNLTELLRQFQGEAGIYSDAAFIVKEIHERLREWNVAYPTETIDLLIELVSKMATITVLQNEETFKSANQFDKESLTAELNSLFVHTLWTKIRIPD